MLGPAFAHQLSIIFGVLTLVRDTIILKFIILDWMISFSLTTRVSPVEPDTAVSSATRLIKTRGVCFIFLLS